VLLAARLAHTIDYMKSVTASALEGSETRDIKNERTLQFTGLELLRRWAIPNVTTASSSANANSSTPAATSRDMTNGERDCRLLMTEREGNHGAARRALPP
jgi:hypothetical protein